MQVSHTYGGIHIYNGEDCITPLPNGKKLRFHSDNATLEEFLDELTLADVAQLVWVLAQSTVASIDIRWSGFPRRGRGTRPGVTITLSRLNADKHPMFISKGPMASPITADIDDEYYSRERCWEHYRWAIGEIIQELG